MKAPFSLHRDRPRIRRRTCAAAGAVLVAIFLLAQPEEMERWSLTTLREKLVKIGAKVVAHGGYVTFQLAELAVPRDLFRKIPRPIDEPRPSPAPA